MYNYVCTYSNIALKFNSSNMLLVTYNASYQDTLTRYFMYAHLEI